MHASLALACVIKTSTVSADLPLIIEDLITDRGKIKLDISLAYANSDKQGVATDDPIVVQTGPASFITLPTVIGESRRNSDSLVATLSLRYGLTRKTEVFSRASYLYSDHRVSDINGTSGSSNSRFTDAWAGINYQFKIDDDTPALLGFAEIALSEKHRNSSHSFKSAMLGATSYHAIDPVVLSITMGYRLNQERRDAGTQYRPGNLLLLNPSIAFAVNEYITLATGVQWTNREADKYDGVAQGYRHTSTDLLLGTSYGISKGSILDLSFKANASGQGGTDLRLNWLHTF
ncbi:MAG: hypothetical protein KZQ97_00310 [Candidatus Thiodiazotropha sp. (ex Dulcina madagascariensis)]|nr:hypothetical protein [Candidatus Thiodiazotropha sp. (ex Dulcina madagascariensis)]